MSPPDPIASATLAQLYIAQGHHQQAKTVLAEVLERSPFDGAALHLRSRVPETGVRVQLSARRGTLRMTWQGAAPTLHAVVVCYGSRERDTRRVVTSAPCRDAFGEHRIDCPWDRGVAVACLGRVDADGFAPKCVTTPVSWG